MQLLFCLGYAQISKYMYDNSQIVAFWDAFMHMPCINYSLGNDNHFNAWSYFAFGLHKGHKVVSKCKGYCAI